MLHLNSVQYAEAPGPAVNGGRCRMALSRDQVIDAAVGILGRYGLADLSMRRLARELGVAPGALYWHVSGKQELLVEVADALLAAITVPPADQPPEEAVVSLALAIRGAVLMVPDGAEVVALAYAVEPRAAGPLRELSRQVGRLGLVGQEREDCGRPARPPRPRQRDDGAEPADRGAPRPGLHRAS